MVTRTTVAFPKAKAMFALWWLLANVISFGFVGGAFHNFELLTPSIAGLGTFELAPALVGALFGAVPSILIGWFQWLILRRYIRVSRWWILTVSAGIGLNHFIADGFPNARAPIIGLLAGSAAVGLLQWLVLRRQVNSFAWWILATIGSWSIGVLIGVSLLDASGLLSRSYTPGLDFQQHGLVGIVLAAIYSILTGVVMVMFLRRKRLGETKPEPALVSN